MSEDGGRKGFPPGEAQAIASLVSFQAGSVVSRVILSSNAGSVTAFAFDEGEYLSEHTTPYDALVQVVEGEAEISIAGTPRKVPAGMAIVLPSGKPHSVRAVTKLKMLLTMLKSV